MGKIEINLTIVGDEEKGDFELVEVKDWKKKTELPATLNVEKFGCVNIHTAYINSSPGHWCLVNHRYIWCPD